MPRGWVCCPRGIILRQALADPRGLAAAGTGTGAAAAWPVGCPGGRSCTAGLRGGYPCGGGRGSCTLPGYTRAR